jgi:hypothetical protein
VRFEVITAVTGRSTIFNDAVPSSVVEVYQCFGGMYYLHLHSQRVSQASSRLQAEFLWNIGKLPRR